MEHTTRFLADEDGNLSLADEQRSVREAALALFELQDRALVHAAATRRNRLASRLKRWLWRRYVALLK